MRHIQATPLISAAVELEDARKAFNRAFDEVENGGAEPWEDRAVKEARERMTAAGFLFSRTMSVDCADMLLKARHVATDARDGHTEWSETLATGLLADLDRLLSGK
jgi:hypothetical protein